MLNKRKNSGGSKLMQSNIIYLSSFLVNKKSDHTLTPKQLLTIKLHNNYIRHKKLMRSIRYNKILQDKRFATLEELFDRIEQQETELRKL
jgi:hypothetical protein